MKKHTKTKRTVLSALSARFWPYLLGICLGPILLASWSSTPPANGSDGEVDEARNLLSQWLEVRRTIAEETRSWKLGKELLVSQIEMQKGELDDLKESLASAEESISDADKKRADLSSQNDLLTKTGAGLKADVAALEERTRALLDCLPGSITEQVRPLSQRFPNDPSDSALSLSVRFQNVIGVLNFLNKKQREISVTSEVRSLGDGTTAEVSAIYVGIGQGYYVTANGESAGIGHATRAAESTGEWTWEEDDAEAPSIQQAIRIHEGEESAAFVQLPLRAQQEEGTKQ